MKFSASLVATVAALISAASAQNMTTGGSSNYTTGLITALNGANLTILATLLQSMPNLAGALQMGNYSVFAPTNAALTAFVGNASLASVNQTQIMQILQYHITPASVRQSALSVNRTIVPSLLQESLTGMAAPLVLYSGTNGPVIVEAARDVSIGLNATYQNLLIHEIPAVLTPPQNLTTTAVLANVTQLAGFVNTLSPAILPALDRTPRLTVFAPVNSAFAMLNTSALAAIPATNLTNIALNHIINGTVVYSTNITASTMATSAAGQPLTFTMSGGSVIVHSGSTSSNISARIVRPDIPMSNGVMHLIDMVLANPA